MSTNANEVNAEATTTTPAPAQTKAPKPKTVAEDFPSRRIFPTISEAVDFLRASGESISDFGQQKIAAPGMDDEGNFDSAIYTPETAVMVAKLTNKGKGKESSVKAIVVAPIPTLAQLMADKSGSEWVDKIIAKELNHVAVRYLRDAADVSTVVDKMPTTLDAYITSGREAGGIAETYDELYKSIDAALTASPAKAWGKARFTKAELRKAMESSAYAREYYSAVEEYKGESLLVKAIQVGINAAKRRGLDPTIFERWLATRDQKPLATVEEDDEEALDIDSLTDAMLSDEKAEDSTGEQPAPEGAPTA